MTFFCFRKKYDFLNHYIIPEIEITLYTLAWQLNGNCMERRRQHYFHFWYLWGVIEFSARTHLHFFDIFFLLYYASSSILNGNNKIKKNFKFFFYIFKWRNFVIALRVKRFIWLINFSLMDYKQCNTNSNFFLSPFSLLVTASFMPTLFPIVISSKKKNKKNSRGGDGTTVKKKYIGICARKR